MPGSPTNLEIALGAVRGKDWVGFSPLLSSPDLSMRLTVFTAGACQLPKMSLDSLGGS